MSASPALGIALPLAARDADPADFIAEVLAEARAADAAGFEVCLVPDHHRGPPASVVAPLALCAALAAVTQRIRVGPGVLVLPVHAPLHVAEQVTLIDQISRGRAVLGVGAGYQHEDFEAFGIDRAQRGPRFEAGLAEVGRLLGEPGALDPVPVQRPRPPVWVGAWSGVGLRRAARLADGWIADPVRSVTEAAAMADRYRAACDGAPGDVVLMREAWVDGAPGSAERFADAIMPVFRYYGRRGAAEFPDTFAALARDRFVHGSAAECLDQVDAMAAATGASVVVLTLRQPGGPGHEAALQAIRAIGEARAARG
ncbi:LLM class flavin-dependent oxidoreductase [Baekduia soli]|uniref:LLM class flavin-dependent oxidoreductase n=1 Tax=Baekduia soli TaxID=496014 RepID=UPI0016520403|nr:LLM class flavin-dependent oxidoreductase [Baekduia soli]